MRIVHLADIHLGYRQYQRQTSGGMNQREQDVARSLQKTIDTVIELRPDLVLIAGDVFHAVRPSNPAIMHAFIQFSRLAQMLPESVIVMVAGNHDTPRTAETGCILNLFTQLGITVVEGEPKRIPLAVFDASILAVPDIQGRMPAFEPDSTAKYNILLLHGDIEGTFPRYGLNAERAPLTISRKDLGAHRWDYVALGHYHVYREVAPNAFYSGSLDYTSTNPWGELAEEKDIGIEGKGIIEHDLANNTHRFHPIPRSRPWVDLESFSGAGLSPASIDEAIRDALEKCEGGIENKVVRLVVRDVPRHILRDLDHKALRDFKRKALHFHLDTRRPEDVRRDVGQGAPGRRASLADTVREKLRSRPLTENIDRDSLVELGLHYLREADTLAGATLEEATA